MKLKKKLLITFLFVRNQGLIKKLGFVTGIIENIYFLVRLIVISW